MFTAVYICRNISCILYNRVCNIMLMVETLCSVLKTIYNELQMRDKTKDFGFVSSDDSDQASMIRLFTVRMEKA